MRGDEFVNRAHARACVLAIAVRKASGSVIGANFRDWLHLVRSLTDV